jgi:hypothetical protein
LYVWLFKPTDKAAYSGSKQIYIHDFIHLLYFVYARLLITVY